MTILEKAAELVRPFYERGINIARCDFDARTNQMSIRHSISHPDSYSSGFALPGELAREVCRYLFDSCSVGVSSHPMFRETQRQTARLRVEADGVPVDLEWISIPRARGFTLVLVSISSAPFVAAELVAGIEAEAAARLRARVRANGDEKIVRVGQVEDAIQEMCDFPGVGRQVSFTVEYFENDE
ncbi:hypothetical protein [Burkholderia cepacia]|uniref:hypothetical protein n=2 Tax=Burkholderia cepacia TaxID=292 RepID=UPI00141A01A4|nr:hypothetical protein [Burkholderia cepacia]